MSKSSYKDVKTMLQEGTSKEELMKQLEDEINTAQKEINADKVKQKAKEKKKEDLHAAHEKLARAIVDVWNVLSDREDKIELTDEDYQEICSELERREETLTNLDHLHKKFWASPFDTIERFFY